MADDRIRSPCCTDPAVRAGVSDYVDHLLAALCDVEVEATAVPVGPDGRPSPARWLAATDRAAVDLGNR